MIYPEYEEMKERFMESQRIFAEALQEKERLFTMTQPNAIQYDRDKVQTTPSGSVLDKYIIALEESGIDDKIATVRQLFQDRACLLNLKEQELRQSHDKYDRVYVCRYLDGLSITATSKKLNYAKSHVYRIFDRIRDDLRKNEKK